MRNQSWSWYVKLDDGGKQLGLGRHPSDQPPRKTRKGWNPPEEILAAWHRVMREGGHLSMDRDPPLAIAFDDFLSFADQTTKPETRDRYRTFLQNFKDRLPSWKGPASLRSANG